MRSPLLSLWRVGADKFLVDVGTPTRPLRQYEIAVLDDRRMGDDVILPGEVVDVDLRDFEVRRRGAHMRADQEPRWPLKLCGATLTS